VQAPRKPHIQDVSDPDWQGSLMGGGLHRVRWVAVAGLEPAYTDSKKQTNRDLRILDLPSYEDHIDGPHVPWTRLNWSA